MPPRRPTRGQERATSGAPGTGVESGTGSASNTYDLAGHVTFEDNGAGLQFTETRDGAGHVTAATANKHTTGVLNGVSSSKLFANATYSPAGAPLSRLLGNGLTEQYVYDNRLRMQSVTQSQAGSSIGYTNSVVYTSNGNVHSSSDSVNGNWTYGYDALNRLTTASSSAGLNLAWIYDAFGNRKSQTASGTGSAPQPSFTFSGNNNHADASGGFVYDAAGNITQDNQGQSYTYDAEGRIASEGSTTYKYDAEGQLVYENGSHGTQAFLRNSSGQTVSIYNPSGGNVPYSAMYAYIDGQKIGSWQPDVFHFTGQDGLGTKRYESGGYGDIASGTTPIVQASFTSLPFGDMLNSIGTDPTHFTGKERDIESGNDYSGARYYSSSTGRFMSPDPSGLAYADPANPQSLNLYSYVLNNPLKLTDPTGMYCDYSDHNDPASGFDQFQFDYHSSEKECTALDENGNRGAWVNDAETHQDADGQWVDNEGRDPNAGAISSSVDAGGKAPLSGDFTFNMTSTQFIAMMEQSGIRVSILDTLLGLHAGLNLRGEQSTCSIHVTLAPFAGQYGNPASGSFHIDEYNPLTFEPPVDRSPMDVNGGGMQPMSNLGPHVTQDVIPDLKIQAHMGTWTGNQNCPHE